MFLIRFNFVDFFKVLFTALQYIVRKMLEHLLLFIAKVY